MYSIGAVVEQNTAATEQMAAQVAEVNKAIASIASISEDQSASTEEASASTEEKSAQRRDERPGARAGRHRPATQEHGRPLQHRPGGTAAKNVVPPAAPQRKKVRGGPALVRFGPELVSVEEAHEATRCDAIRSGEPAAPRRQSLLRSQARCALLPAATPLKNIVGTLPRRGQLRAAEAGDIRLAGGG